MFLHATQLMLSFAFLSTMFFTSLMEYSSLFIWTNETRTISFLFQVPTKTLHTAVVCNYLNHRAGKEHTAQGYTCHSPAWYQFPNNGIYNPMKMDSHSFQPTRSSPSTVPLHKNHQK